MVQPTQTQTNAKEYFELPEYQDTQFIQLIDGQVITPMPPTLKHQTIVGNIFFLFKMIVKKLGGLAFVAPAEVWLDDDNVYEPDVMYISSENIGIAQQDKMRVKGAPDLVVEVLSPGTARYDRQEKYQAYERHGVLEYWIVDPLHETIEIWIRNQNAKFDRKGSFSIHTKFYSTVLQQDVIAEDIFAEG